MLLHDRIRAERDFHDEQARGRAVTLAVSPSRFVFDDAVYLDHETWIRPAFAKLGEVAGRSVLDYGCGHGMAAVVLARAGATVTAFDLSPEYVREAKIRADANGVTVHCLTAAAEHLPFDDASFDMIWGSAILHHLDIATAAVELRRVLKPGGVAVFAEPWGGNPLLEFARRWLPYPGKHRTRDERPLTQAQLDQLKQHFPQLKTEGFQLCAMMGRIFRRRFPWLEKIDAALFDRSPSLKFWCRYLVLTLPIA